MDKILFTCLIVQNGFAFFQTNKVVAIRPAKITNLDAKMADAYPILGSAMVKMIAGIVPTKVIFVRKKRAPISR